MIDFPASPANGQVFTSGAQSWTWDGTKWVASGVAAMPPLATGDNRIINGDMRIDQRNNGASGTATAVYTVDRWIYSTGTANKLTWGRGGPGLGAPAVPFQYCLNLISSSSYVSAAGDYFYIGQPIEADMIGDFMWGTANAKPVTLSFWASSTIGGTHSGALNGPRTYTFTYTLAANTWTFVSITIPGDTGTPWTLSGNGEGMRLCFDLGTGATYRGPANAWTSSNYIGATGAVSIVGTASASLTLTGVKLEIGSVATPFNRQSLAKSMADCQRYYQNGNLYIVGNGTAGTSFATSEILPTSMRSSPTLVVSSNNNSNMTGFALNFVSTMVYSTGNATGTGSTTINTSFTASAEF